jgi:CarboxypepD_reg-like domain
MRATFSTLCACLLLLATSAKAQTLASTNAANTAASPASEPIGIIKGQVLNEDGQPLPGATILIKGTKNVFSTNAEGTYSFPSALPAQRVQVSLLGYSEAEMSVRVGSTNAVTLQLLPGTRIKHGGRHNGKLLAVGKNE